MKINSLQAAPIAYEKALTPKNEDYILAAEVFGE
jgi:hypothetical protein